MMLTMLLTSCLTLQINAPKVNFPDPPAPDNFEYDKQEDIIKVPSWFWISLATFYIDYDAALDRYNSYCNEDVK